MNKDDSVKILSLARDRKSNLKMEKEILDEIELINKKTTCTSESKSPMRRKTNGSIKKQTKQQKVSGTKQN